MKLEDYSKYYIQGSEHYLIPKAVFIELYEEMNNFRKESRKNKEVIDKAIEEITIIIRDCEESDKEDNLEPSLNDLNYILDILKEVE